MPFDSYVRKGLLKRQPPNARQIAGQMDRARKDLKTAEKVLKEDPEWAATIAYQAALRAGRALLFSHGHLPAGPAQHKTVVEWTGKLLGSEARFLAEKFENMRRRRNLFFYEVDPLESVTETEAAIQTAKKLVAATAAKIRTVIGNSTRGA